MEIIDKSFTKAPMKYIIQSLLAVVALAIILYFVETLTHGYPDTLNFLGGQRFNRSLAGYWCK